MKKEELKEMAMYKITMFLEMFRDDINLPFNDINFDFVLNDEIENEN